MEKITRWLWQGIFFLLLIALIFFLVQKRLYFPSPVFFPTSLSNLPAYAFYSLLRMFAAYLLSLIFSLTYGTIAALRRGAERIMLPILDVLQSIPVLGFFPAAIFFFIGLFKGGRIGVELASIFLIFTSQAWNMTFGVYESLKTIPKDVQEASTLYDLKGQVSFRRLLLPACTSKLIYNSILSWAGGWYFLIAAEIIAVGPINYRLPGLGSFLFETSLKGQIGLTLIGLGTLVSIIVFVDLLFWRPLTVWAAKFRYEFVGVTEARPRSLLLGIFNRLRETEGFRQVWFAVSGVLKIPFLLILIPSDLLFRLYRERAGVRKLFLRFGRIIFLAFLLLVAYLSYRAAVALVQLVEKPLARETTAIPLAILFSMSRLAVAYLISLVWTIPVAVKIAHSRRLARFLTPFFEIAASVPATALFPLIVFFILRYTGSLDLAAILLVLTGMQWYLLFNLIAGTTAIPQDLKEVTEVFQVSGWLYWRRLIFPAIFPSLITGSITAWGGGWNALIVAEYFVFKGKTYSAFGIGSLLDKATYVQGNSQLMLFSLVAMVLVIVLLNRFFWRRLYEMAARKFKIEY